jgi:hypothetical protein
MTSSSESPIDRLVDLAVYAPVGLALAARDVVPGWVDAGRRQVESQLTMARALGRLAVGQGSRQAGAVLRRAASQAEGVLAGLGLVPRAEQDTSGRSASTPPPTPTTRPAPAPPAGPATDNGQPVPDAAGLPIPGYDTLSASQVVQRLPGLSAEGLDAIEAYERAGRARKTVLLKVAQLRNAP